MYNTAGRRHAHLALARGRDSFDDTAPLEEACVDEGHVNIYGGVVADVVLLVRVIRGHLRTYPSALLKGA